VARNPEHWFIRGGLAETVFYIMLSQAFVSPLLYIFDPTNLLLIYKRRRLAKASDTGQKLTQ
jgi:hypothetical protein